MFILHTFKQAELSKERKTFLNLGVVSDVYNCYFRAQHFIYQQSHNGCGFLFRFVLRPTITFRSY